MDNYLPVLLFGGFITVLAVGPSVSNLLDAYRGIVLRVQGDDMLVAFAEKAPKNFDKITAKAGDIVEKERMSFNPRVVAREAGDHQLVSLHARFVKKYSGVIVLINPPKTPHGPHTAIIQLEDGKKLNVPLYGEHLSTAEVGSHVRKEPEAWEPFLVPENEVTAPAPPEKPEPTPDPSPDPSPTPTPRP